MLCKKKYKSRLMHKTIYIYMYIYALTHTKSTN